MWWQGPTLDDQTYQKAINDQSLCYQHFVKNKNFTNNDNNWERLHLLQNNFTNTIETTKRQYFANIVKKLFDSNTDSKIYWSILKCFYGVETFPVFCIIFMKTNLLLISEKGLNF